MGDTRVSESGHSLGITGPDGKLTFRPATPEEIRQWNATPMKDIPLGKSSDRRPRSPWSPAALLDGEGPSPEDDAKVLDAIPARTDIDWHHSDQGHRYGRDKAGRDYELNRKTGEVKRITSAAERAKITALAMRPGSVATQIARRYDVSLPALRKWVAGARKASRWQVNAEGAVDHAGNRVGSTYYVVQDAVTGEIAGTYRGKSDADAEASALNSP